MINTLSLPRVTIRMEDYLSPTRPEYFYHFEVFLRPHYGRMVPITAILGRLQVGGARKAARQLKAQGTKYWGTGGSCVRDLGLQERQITQEMVKWEKLRRAELDGSSDTFIKEALDYERPMRRLKVEAQLTKLEYQQDRRPLLFWCMERDKLYSALTQIGELTSDDATRKFISYVQAAIEFYTNRGVHESHKMHIKTLREWMSLPFAKKYSQDDKVLGKLAALRPGWYAPNVLVPIKDKREGNRPHGPLEKSMAYMDVRHAMEWVRYEITDQGTDPKMMVELGREAARRDDLLRSVRDS